MWRHVEGGSMKDPYQWERNNAKTIENFDTFEQPPLDFRTEEERDHIEAAMEEARIAQTEKARMSRLQTLAEEKAHKDTIIKRQERWLAAWHVVLLIGAITALALIVRANI
jgi:hypothetical protein